MDAVALSTRGAPQAGMLILMTAAILGLPALGAMPGQGGGDVDGDGLSDIGEYTLGTDPLLADTDGGGIPDGWEAYFDQATHRATDPAGQVFVNPRYRFDATAATDDGGHGLDPGQLLLLRSPDADRIVNDPDGDGATNAHEYALGTDPTNPDTDGDRLYDTDDPAPLVAGWVGNWEDGEEWDPDSRYPVEMTYCNYLAGIAFPYPEDDAEYRAWWEAEMVRAGCAVGGGQHPAGGQGQGEGAGAGASEGSGSGH